MASLAAVTLVSALAAGVALSGYAMSSRSSSDALRNDVASRYAQLSEEDPSICVSCVGDVCEAVTKANAARIERSSPDARRASMIAAALETLENRRRATADYLASMEADCPLRTCLSSALSGVTVAEAEASMSALDHLLEADDSLRDVHVDFATPPLTILELVRAIEGARP
jgi:hypothetical protein